VGVLSFLLVGVSAFADEFFVATRSVVINLRLLSFDQSTAVDAGELLEKMSILVNLNLIIGHDFSTVRTFNGHLVKGFRNLGNLFVILGDLKWLRIFTFFEGTSDEFIFD